MRNLSNSEVYKSSTVSDASFTLHPVTEARRRAFRLEAAPVQEKLDGISELIDAAEKLPLEEQQSVQLEERHSCGRD